MFEKLLQKIARAMARNKVPYMVIGGHAVMIYGEARHTQDIDVTLGIDVGDLQKLRKILAQLPLKIIVKDPSVFVKDTMVLPTEEKSSGIRVEFIFSNSTYEQEALQRVKKFKVGDVAVSFASLEDVIIHKVVAARPRDIEDVRGILLRNPKYDSRYIKKWLSAFDQSLGQGCVERFVRLKDNVQNY